MTVDAKDVTIENNVIKIPTSFVPYLPNDTERTGNFAYVMFVKDGEIISEPYIPAQHKDDGVVAGEKALYLMKDHDCYDEPGRKNDPADYNHVGYQAAGDVFVKDGKLNKAAFDSVLIDYYTAHEGDGSQQIEITADKFGGNFYLEASTLFRDQRGVDMPAEFIIPNCKIQSNFTFTMASSGDPSTFTFTMDAFPDYLRFDHSKKVLAAIQIIKAESDADEHRHQTSHDATDLAW